MNRGRAPETPVFLVGFMGVGKSAIGRALAARLGWAFADTDALVEQAEGRTIEEIFLLSGEGRFREVEWDALRSLEGATRLVVATGGGLFSSVVHRAFMRVCGISCWLDAPLSLIKERLCDPSSRPLWTAGDALSRRVFFEKRRAAYALADVRVDVSTGGPDRLAIAVDAARCSL